MPRHPVSDILRRAARMGVVPDETELHELSVDDPTRDRIRVAAREVADQAAAGGMRGRHHAAEAADRLADTITRLIPPGYRDAVPTEPADTDQRTAAEYADAVVARRRYGIEDAESIDERIARRTA